MAGAITHLLVAEEAIARMSESEKSFAALLSRNRAFLLLGSVSPDLPYATSSLSPQSVWADRMHYQDTNLIPMRMLGGIAPMRKSADRQTFSAFLAGYIAHCVTDATIHPIVQAAVGPYAENKTAHRTCEMVQDSLLFTREMKRNLRSSHYVGVLASCGPQDTLDRLLTLWREALQCVHAEVQPRPDPHIWFAAYKTMLGAASDWDILAKLARPLVGPTGPFYLTEEGIHEDFPHRSKFWFEDIKLPPGQNRRGAFMKDAFEHAAGNVALAWRALWKDLQNPNGIAKDGKGGDLAKLLPNWDLDTGADMGRDDLRVTYWSVPGEQG